MSKSVLNPYRQLFNLLDSLEVRANESIKVEVIIGLDFGRVPAGVLMTVMSREIDVQIDLSAPSPKP